MAKNYDVQNMKMRANFSPDRPPPPLFLSKTDFIQYFQQNGWADFHTHEGTVILRIEQGKLVKGTEKEAKLLTQSILDAYGCPRKYQTNAKKHVIDFLIVHASGALWETYLEWSKQCRNLN